MIPNKNPSSLRLGILAIVLFLILASFMSWTLQAPFRVIQSRKASQGTMTFDPRRLHMTVEIRNYLTSLKSHDDWWMKTTPAPDLNTAEILTYVIVRTRSALEHCRTASPFAEQIAQKFHGFYTSVYTNGYPIINTVSNIDMEGLAGKLEICVVSEEEYRKGDLSSPLFYREDWNAIVVAGKNWPELFFGAVLMHELGHALKKEQRHSNLHLPESEWYKEEVEMHEFEGLIMDRATRGKYLSAIEEIISNHRKARDAPELLGSVTKDDFLKLDTIIGINDCGAETRGNSVAGHILLMGFRFIDKNGGGIDAKVAHYKWIEGE